MLRLLRGKRLRQRIPAPEAFSPPLSQVVPLTNMKGVGFLAERFVAEYLKKEGWQALKMNWRTPYAELDWVGVNPQNVLVAVEVKARHWTSWCRGEDALRPHQRQRIGRGIAWVADQLPWEKEYRVDLADVRLSAQQPTEILWHRDIQIYF